MKRKILDFGKIVLIFSICIGFVLIAEAGVRTGNDLDRIISIGQNENHAAQHADYLINEIGSRPTNSVNFLRACQWAKDEFTKFRLANVRLELVSQADIGFSDEKEKAGYEYLYKLMFGVDFNGKKIPIYNVVADIPGSEIPDEYVIVGAHLDCVEASVGATDNGTGVAAILEAARILAVSGEKPKRTIRFILFGGEEIGTLGSKGYINNHPELIPKISAVYIMDHGANYISGLDATAPLLSDMQQIFENVGSIDTDMAFEVNPVDYFPKLDTNCCFSKTNSAADNSDGKKMVMKGGCAPAKGCGSPVNIENMEPMLVKQIAGNGDTITAKIMLAGLPLDENSDPFETGKMLARMGISLEDDMKSMGTTDTSITKTKMLVRGLSDHVPFLYAGIPAFWIQQKETESVPYHAHTSEDSFDKIIPAYLEHSALVIAIGAFNTANLNHLLSRDKLMNPNPDSMM